MVKSQRVKYEFSIRYYIILTKCLPVAKFWAKLLGPKPWLPLKRKIFVFAKKWPKIKMPKKWKPYPKLNFKIKLLAK